MSICNSEDVSSISFSSRSLNNRRSVRISSAKKDDHKQNLRSDSISSLINSSDDLDEYASNNESTFYRRSSIRMSRKSSRIIPGNNNNNNNNINFIK